MNDKPEQEIVKYTPDPLAIATQISGNLRVDKQLKRGAEMMLYGYNADDEAIAEEIGLTVKTWRKWRFTPEFLAYYEERIEDLYTKYRNRGVAIQEIISELILEQIVKIKQEHDESGKDINLDKLSRLVTKFKKANPAVTLQQNILSQGDTKITTVTDQKNKGSVNEQIDALQKHIDQIKRGRAKEIKAEVVEDD